MILSFWRWGHLTLALSSFLFVAIASISGMVLAIEPIDHQLQLPSQELTEVTLSDLLPKLQEQYLEIFSLQVNDHDGVVLSAMDLEGNLKNYCIDPADGSPVFEVKKQSPVFAWFTSLHRSLFLHGLGRFFVGLNCFLLLLIVFSGVALIIKRQQGIAHFLKRIIRDNFYQYYHTYVSRMALLPILIVTLTGTFMSLERFGLVPHMLQDTTSKEYANEVTPGISVSEMPIFQQATLNTVRELQFPFSKDVIDPYVLMLEDRELEINQKTGEVLAETPYPLLRIMTEWSLLLHTGRGSYTWSLVLLVSCICLLFFMYTGFKLTFRRRAGKLKNHYRPNDCEYVILIGSEGGTTQSFASQVYHLLIKDGRKCYILELNRYQEFPAMKHLLVFTSTYGQGEAPANAGRFLSLFEAQRPKEAYGFSVVGFGSLSYPDYCQFASRVSNTLQQHELAREVLPLHTINNRSWESFKNWMDAWNDAQGMDLKLPARDPAELKNRKKKEHFYVLRKTKAEDHADETFLIWLRSDRQKKRTSGDLIAVFSPGEPVERLYSASVLGSGHLLLSVKRHTLGVCSNYLNDLKPGDRITGATLANRHFYFPKRAEKVVLISTGTGIAPFLGMLASNDVKVQTYLYWGARTAGSFSLYKDLIGNYLQEGKLTVFSPAYSREAPNTYVQDLVQRDQSLMADTLRIGGVVMICGAVAMQGEVVRLLDHIATVHLQRPLSYYQNKGQLRMDCY